MNDILLGDTTLRRTRTACSVSGVPNAKLSVNEPCSSALPLASAVRTGVPSPTDVLLSRSVAMPVGAVALVLTSTLVIV